MSNANTDIEKTIHEFEDLEKILNKMLKDQLDITNFPVIMNGVAIIN